MVSGSLLNSKPSYRQPLHRETLFIKPRRVLNNRLVVQCLQFKLFSNITDFVGEYVAIGILRKTVESLSKEISPGRSEQGSFGLIVVKAIHYALTPDRNNVLRKSHLRYLRSKVNNIHLIKF